MERRRKKEMRDGRVMWREDAVMGESRPEGYAAMRMLVEK
jgi:hypothetical protein